MKLISYQQSGKKSYGILTEKGVIDLANRLGSSFPDLKTLLAKNALSIAAACQNDIPDVSLASIAYLPVIDNPGKILCVGMNYAEKRVEFNETNPAPTLFVRFPDSQTAHNGPVIKPLITREFDYEGELAVVIGSGGLHIREENALEHIAGYSCYMDGSVRDWQHTWYTAGKNWRQTGSFGPCLVTTDEIPDPGTLGIRTYLNGLQMQNDSTANLIHSIPSLVAYISSFTRLSAGDVIITGSPGGVGKKRVPPLFMKAGDVVEVEIDKIGRLKNTVVDETVPNDDLLSDDASRTSKLAKVA